jgi:predicted metalloprotease with PDZ domain
LTLATAFAAPARAQAAQDSLIYTVTVVSRDGYLDIQGRLTSHGGPVPVLASPPAAGAAGTHVSGFTATDDGGAPLSVRRAGATYTVTPGTAAAIRFRYRLDMRRRAPEGSTGSGLDSTRLYAATRSVFVAPDPTVYRKLGLAYPTVVVRLRAPEGWRVVAGWQASGEAFRPGDGDDLLGSTLAAAGDFRDYAGAVGADRWQLAIRGQRYFPDSALVGLVAASLRGGVEAFGPLPVPLVSYIADVGRKGRMSGSLQGHSSIGLVWEPSEVLDLPRSHDLFHETLHLWFGGALESERWWVEGVTDYLAARLYAEWQRRPDDLALLCFQSLRHYRDIDHNTRLTMAEEARRRVGGDNTELLVYRKGMLAGLLLDAAVRSASEGRRTLDDVARQALALADARRSRYVREAELRGAVVASGGTDAARVWDRVVAGTDLLREDEVAAALHQITGQRFEPPPLAKVRKELRR